MERPGPGAGDVTMNHGSKAALFEDRAHVHVYEEQPDRDHRYTRVDKDRRIAYKSQGPRQRFRVPQGDSGEQQQNYAVEDSPEEKLLSVVEPSHRRQFVILILDVFGDGLRPDTVGVVNFHVAVPLLKSPKQ